MPIVFNQCDFAFQKQYAVLLDGPPDMASPAPKRKALASVDEQNRTDEMKHNLEVEEKRANQMKLLIQKLLMADVSGYVQIVVYPYKLSMQRVKTKVRFSLKFVSPVGNADGFS